jgi:hypothetical protein
LVEENWAILDKVTSVDVLKAFRLIGQLKDLSKYGDDQIWAAIQKKIQGTGEELRRPGRFEVAGMEGLLQPGEGQGEPHLQVAHRRSADRLHEVLREDRARGEVAGGPGARRLHPHRVATRFR